MADLVLVGEGFSPWTEKARWALDHHGLPYAYDEYTPLIGEPWLRIRARKPEGPVSVPWLLASDGLSLGDSLAITREADRRSPVNAPLFPVERAEEILAWNGVADRIKGAGRAQILRQTEDDHEVAKESLPPFVPDVLRSPLAGSVKLATSYIRKKYSVKEIPDEALVPELETIRAALRGEEPLLGTFSIADIAVATAMQAIEPHAVLPLALLPAQRRAWARPALADAYRDLLTWRDAMYARYRSSAHA